MLRILWGISLPTAGRPSANAPFGRIGPPEADQCAGGTLPPVGPLHPPEADEVYLPPFHCLPPPPVRPGGPGRSVPKALIARARVLHVYARVNVRSTFTRARAEGAVSEGDSLPRVSFSLGVGASHLQWAKGPRSGPLAHSPPKVDGVHLRWTLPFGKVPFPKGREPSLCLSTPPRGGGQTVYHVGILFSFTWPSAKGRQHSDPPLGGSEGPPFGRSSGQIPRSLK